MDRNNVARPRRGVGCAVSLPCLAQGRKELFKIAASGNLPTVASMHIGIKYSLEDSLALTVPTGLPSSASSGTEKEYFCLSNSAGASVVCRTCMVTSAFVAAVSPPPSWAQTVKNIVVGSK